MIKEEKRLREIEEEIIEVLFDLTIDKTNKQRIRMGEILDRLGQDLSKTQLTNIVRRKLEPIGFVDYLPYEGILLTREGFQAARRIARNHRLAEAMLYQIFNVPFSELHEQACSIEHGITDRMADHIYRKLGEKKTPFGMPIPMGEIEDLGCDDKVLIEIPAGEKVTLTRIRSHSNDTANELLSCGVKGIGVKILVKKITQDGILVEMDKTKSKIPIHLSKVLCVKLDENEN
jgi:DtxR family Mn-dependent transcriptional regulator